MRNIYESEVGQFISAEIPQVEKSKDLLPEVRRMLKGREHHQVLLYCTGGIRCEKASSFLINEGIKNVKQLQGGIIQYAHDIKKEGLESKFVGKNFVFDARLGERVRKILFQHVICVVRNLIVTKIVKMMLVIFSLYSVQNAMKS